MVSLTIQTQYQNLNLTTSPSFFVSGETIKEIKNGFEFI